MDNVMGMGYPSESMESIYRNSLEDIKKFLEEWHKDHYKVRGVTTSRSFTATARPARGEQIGDKDYVSD